MTEQLAKCILCNKISPLTVEHIIPDALDGKLIFNCLCKDCNSKLGEKVDTQLTNYGPIKIIRATHGITGKTGKIPLLLPTIMYDQNGKKFRLFQDEGKLVARSLPSPIVQSEEEGKITLRWSCDSSDKETIKKRLDKATKKYGPKITNTDLVERTFDNLLLEGSITLDTKFPVLPFLKIAYEFLFLSFPDCENWLNTQEMRQALLANDESLARKFVLLCGFEKAPYFCHFLSFSQGIPPKLSEKRSPTSLFCNVTLFGQISCLVFLGDPGRFLENLENHAYLQLLDPQLSTNLGLPRSR